LNFRDKIKITVINGSIRKDNYTEKALNVAIRELKMMGNVETTYIDPSEYNLSFPGMNSDKYDDSEKLREIVSDSDGLLLGTPEYNGTYTAALKLVIENLGYPSLMDSKPVALIGVASGKIGAVKSLEHLRSVCAHNGSFVLPFPVSIPQVQHKFDEKGDIIDEGIENLIHSLSKSLIHFIEKIEKKEVESKSKIMN
jgi:NAD(P)H-dependent FMN reductase